MGWNENKINNKSQTKYQQKRERNSIEKKWNEIIKNTWSTTNWESLKSILRPIHSPTTTVGVNVTLPIFFSLTAIS